jgi:hypothetical protein
MKIVWIKEEEMGQEKIMGFFLGVKAGFTLVTNWPWAIVSSKKWGTMRFYRPWPKDSSVNHHLLMKEHFEKGQMTFYPSKG